MKNELQLEWKSEVANLLDVNCVVVASTAKSGKLPVLVMPDEAERLAKICAANMLEDDEKVIVYFMAGYKANPNKWTDEDIKKAIEYGLWAFKDFDRDSNYDAESIQKGLKQIQTTIYHSSALSQEQ